MTSKKKKKNTNSEKNIQERLLDAAEELFCEKGFDRTSIRDIANLVGCNIASVNYYFGSKNNLYLEVWRRHLIPIRDSRIASIENIMSQKHKSINLEKLLASIAESFVEPPLETDGITKMNNLMARELIDKHLPANVFADEVISPINRALEKAFIRTCPDLDKSKIRIVIFFIIGQLLHLLHTQSIFGGDQSSLGLPKLNSKDIIKHFVKFSSAGIRTYSRAKNND